MRFLKVNYKAGCELSGGHSKEGNMIQKKTHTVHQLNPGELSWEMHSSPRSRSWAGFRGGSMMCWSWGLPHRSPALYGAMRFIHLTKNISLWRQMACKQGPSSKNGCTRTLNTAQIFSFFTVGFYLKETFSNKLEGVSCGMIICIMWKMVKLR